MHIKLSTSRKCLDHVIVLHEQPLQRLLSSSFAYYPYSDTSRTYAPHSRIYGYIKGRFPLSLATVKPRCYVSKFGQRTEVTL